MQFPFAQNIDVTRDQFEQVQLYIIYKLFLSDGYIPSQVYSIWPLEADTSDWAERYRFWPASVWHQT